jgi:glycosyltransferase involved in cell wall biosynthesis
MRVAHVHRIAGIGGSERHLLALLPALAGLGAEPVFVGLDDPRADPEPFYRLLGRTGIPAVRLPSPRDADPVLAVRLHRALRRLAPDLVHTHLVHADVYGALGLTPLVSTKHNDDPFRSGPFRFVERLLTRRASAVIAITEALGRFLVERVGLPPEKVHVVHYGLDDPPEPWSEGPPPTIPEGARVLLAVGRLVGQKGHDVAVAALPAVRAEHPEARLVILGDGPLRDRLLGQASALHVDDAVVLPGRAGDVAAWLARADVFVHPARWEGFGLVLLEAMLAACPVVASRVSSVPEIVVDGQTGLLVAADDPGALAAAVTRLLGDAGLAARMGDAGRARARTQFSIERMARRTLEVYETSLAA